MSTEVSDETVKKLVRDLKEAKRLRQLSNEQLVRETLKFADFNDCELHVEELMTRVWPEWINSYDADSKSDHVNRKTL